MLLLDARGCLGVLGVLGVELSFCFEGGTVGMASTVLVAGCLTGAVVSSAGNPSALARYGQDGWYPRRGPTTRLAALGRGTDTQS